MSRENKYVFNKTSCTYPQTKNVVKNIYHTSTLYDKCIIIILFITTLSSGIRERSEKLILLPLLLLLLYFNLQRQRTFL